MTVPDGPKKLAITGLGGVGKTQVALELAYRMRDRDATCSIFWIPCTSPEAVEQAYMAIAQVVGLRDVPPAKVKERVTAYLWYQEGRWLLIFDNADNVEMWTHGSNGALTLLDILPSDSRGHVILTTRNRELAVDLVSSCIVHVGELDRITGVEFLEKSLVRKDLMDNFAAIINLLEQLTFLPLAISQAEQDSDVVELLSKDFGDDGYYKDMQNPVAKTWLILFYQVQKQDLLAAEYLSLMACFNPRNIPRSLLLSSESRLKMTDALGLLSAYSFITLHTGNDLISLHRLVHLANRNWMRIEEQFSTCIHKATQRLSMVFPDNNHANRPRWREYLPHALSLLREREFRDQQEQYINDGRYNEAEELDLQVMATRKEVLGPEHPDTLTSMHDLAHTWKQLEKIQDALTLMQKCLELHNKVLGSDHPHARSTSNALRGWETPTSPPAQQTHQDYSILPASTPAPNPSDSDLMPTRRSTRQAFMRFFRRHNLRLSLVN
ncbi:hypothetical protein BDV06DRAFT_232801 [Aspergillus oleicola]